MKPYLEGKSNCSFAGPAPAGTPAKREPTMKRRVRRGRNQNRNFAGLALAGSDAALQYEHRLQQIDLVYLISLYTMLRYILS